MSIITGHLIPDQRLQTSYSICFRSPHHMMLKAFKYTLNGAGFATWSKNNSTACMTFNIIWLIVVYYLLSATQWTQTCDMFWDARRSREWWHHVLTYTNTRSDRGDTLPSRGRSTPLTHTPLSVGGILFAYFIVCRVRMLNAAGWSSIPLFHSIIPIIMWSIWSNMCNWE